jgi:phytoene desaturase
MKKEGFTFDMGPSWYWMPDVLIVSSLISKKTSDYYELIKLSSLQGLFCENEFISIADNLAEIEANF